jgi:DNA-binding transcriptional LysR family regulator
MLEKNLDTQLIDRSNNSISLTENGKVLLKYAERILALCEESCRVIIELKNGERGKLNVGASQTIGTYLLPKILVLFSQNYPQIKLDVQVNSTRIISDSVMGKKVDIAIVGGKVPTELRNNLVITEFIEDELVLILPIAHPFAKNGRISKIDLYHLTFISLNSNSTIQNFIDESLKRYNIDLKQLKVKMELNSIEGIKTAVSLGLGAAFVSCATIQKEMQLNTIQIVKIENIRITRTLSIISNPESYKSKAFKLFLKQLKLARKNYNN